jgi:hypothetical protein
MSRVHRETGLSSRSSKGRLSRTVPFPGWITIPFIMIIGLILWVGVLSDSSGRLTMPGTGAILYVAVVIGVASLLAYRDRKRNIAGKGKNGTGSRTRHKTVVR